MSEFFKAELKDRFLEYALERRDYFEIQTLYDEFLRPNYDLHFVKRLVKEIQQYDAELLDIMSGNGQEIFMLASTSTTQDFLHEGGFMEMYVKEEEKWDTFLNHLGDSRKLSKDEKQLLKKNSPGAKRERKLLMALIIAIGISFLFTVFSIFKATFLEPEYVPLDEFERKIQQLESQYLNENQQLRMQLEKQREELDSLNSLTPQN